MPQWNVLYVQRRYEFKVEQQFERLGIEHYLPKVKVLKNWSDRIKKLIEPAFPSYIFVKIDNKDRNAVFQVKGVCHYVKHAQRDAFISEEELELIKRSEPVIQSGSLQKLDLQKGQEVYIKQGLFAGQKAQLIDWVGKKAVQLKLKTLSMGFCIEIPKEDLQFG